MAKKATKAKSTAVTESPSEEDDASFVKRELARAIFVSGQPTRASVGSIDDETFQKQRREAWDAQKKDLLSQAGRVLRLIENGKKISVTKVG